MVEYRLARKDEYEKCLNFGNYVFSQAHRPHDFMTLLPKTYKNEDTFEPVPHFIAIRDDGEIRGLIALRDTPLKFLDETLSCGFVGTVSVHPYARGEGHMKHNMAALLDYADKKNYDILVLGGQRQRYGYFGFHPGGAQITYHINSTNIRHAYSELECDGISFREIKDEIDVDYAFDLYGKNAVRGIRSRESFLDCLRSWNSTPRLILNEGAPAGYMSGFGSEIVLEDEGMMPFVLKAMFNSFNLTRIEISCGIHEVTRRNMLSALCEYSVVSPFEMLRVLNWKNVLSALLKYKAAYTRLEDGQKTIVIDGKPITITVTGGHPEVTEGGNAENAPAFDNMAAQRLFFDIGNLFAVPCELPAGWTGIPFFMSTMDGF